MEESMKPWEAYRARVEYHSRLLQALTHTDFLAGYISAIIGRNVTNFLYERSKGI